MKEITSIISDYLKNPNTDFAFFINGQWGSGKTYFLKNKLFPEIKKIEAPTANKEKTVFFQPIYISLFGISNIDDVYERLLLELNPILKSKGAFFLKNILSKSAGFFNIPWFGNNDIKDYLSVFSIPNNKVLFFDDLERIEEGSINGILGHINTFVEHQNLKTVIVGDEKILEKKVSDYKQTKEKLIRFTSTFKTNINGVFDDMIQTYSPAYKVFLTKYKNFICDLYAKGEHENLRTLHFNLDIFEKIYHVLEPLKGNKYYNEVLDSVLYFATTYSIEYKKEKDNDKLQSLQNISNRFVSLPINNFSSSNLLGAKVEEKEIKEKTYNETFREMYLVFNNHRFEYFPEVANYINSGFLNENELMNQSNNIILELERNEISKESEIIERLSDLFKLEDNELQPLYNEVLRKVENGDFDLIAYPNIFSFFINIEYFKLENLLINDALYKSFHKGIDISKTRAQYNSAFRHKISIWDNGDIDGKQKYQPIADYAIEANDSLFEIQVKNYAEMLFSLIKENKHQEVYDCMANSEFRLVPIFSFLNHKTVFDQLKASKNNTIVYFNYGIHERYQSNKIHEDLKSDIDFLAKLLDLINKYTHDIKNKDRKISVVCFENIGKTIIQIIKKYERDSQ